MAINRFRWTEEYCKAVQHYLNTAQRSVSGKRLKKGELERIATTLGISKSVLLMGMQQVDTVLNRYLKTGIYTNTKEPLTDAELIIVVNLVLESADNLQHAFRCAALYFRANSMTKIPVKCISQQYYTRLKPVNKPKDLLFNIESLTDVFGGNVKNNLRRGRSTRGVI